MQVIIIPNQLKSFYDKKFDSFNAIQPIELANGEYFLTEDILIFLQSYADNTTYPQSIRESARLTKLEFESLELREITESDLKEGVLPDAIEMFPYPTRNIRVFLPHKQITDMIETPYKPLIDMALLVPYEKSNEGITLWLERFGNEYYTDEQVEGVLNMFGAQIIKK